MSQEVQQETAAIAADGIHAFDEVHRTILSFVQQGETAAALSLVSLPSVGGDPLYWRTCTYHGGLAAAVLAAAVAADPRWPASDAGAVADGEDGVPLPMLYSFLTRTLTSLAEQERQQAASQCPGAATGSARCKHLLLSVIKRLEVTLSSPVGEDAPRRTGSTRRAGGKRGRKTADIPSAEASPTPTPAHTDAVASAVLPDHLSLIALLHETCAGLSYVNPLEGLPPSAPAAAGSSAEEPALAALVRHQPGDAAALDAVQLLQQIAVPLPGTTAIVAPDFDAVGPAPPRTQTQDGSATEDDEEEADAVPAPAPPPPPRGAHGASLAAAVAAELRQHEEQRQRAALSAFDAFEVQASAAARDEQVASATSTSATRAGVAAGGPPRQIQRRCAYTALEDRAIIEGVGQFGQLPKAFNLIFAKYVQVWQVGRTAMNLYDHWRDALRARVRRRMDLEAAARAHLKAVPPPAPS